MKIKIFNNQYLFLLCLFIFSFLIKSAVFYFYLGNNNNYWQVDSNTYHKIAQGLVINKSFSVDDNPNFYRLPGYPLFLASGYKIFGIDTKNVLWLQILLASFIPILIYFLALIIMPGNLLLARMASIYSAIHIGLTLYSGFFMSESLFIFLLLIFSILFFKNKHLFSAGVFLGLAGLVRPIGHYLIFFVIIILFFKNKNIKISLIKSLFLILGFIITVSPWLIRNYNLQGQVFLHSLPGGLFLNFAAARSVMIEKDLTYDRAKKYLTREIDINAQDFKEKYNRSPNEIEYCNLQMDLALQYFKKYPLITIKNFLLDIFRTSFSLYSAEILYLENNRASIDYFSQKRTIKEMIYRYVNPKTDKIGVQLLILFEILLFILILLGVFGGFILAILGFFVSKFEYIKNIYICFLPIILLFLVIGLAGGYSRMRLPAESFLIILSFIFYTYIYNIFYKHKIV